ncbi:MAG TPA: hypothetical protein VN451_04890, partial [Chitinophagaceae bacterium]|nr:hypothetical protein [Chitinophagaceae bacterium]
VEYDTSHTSVKNPDYFVELNIKKKNKIPAVYFGKTFFRDARLDKMKMGFVNLDVNPVTHKMVFKQEAGAYLTREVTGGILIDSLFDSLYVVLNDLWFSQTRTQTGWLERQLMYAEELLSNCFLNADLFIYVEGRYKYLGNLDTMVSEKGWLPDKCNKLLEKSISALLAAADGFCSSQPFNGELYSADGFEKFIAGKNQYPVLNTSDPESGIYFNYRDFLNNTPLPMNFTTEEDKNFRVLKYKASGDTTADKAWGFCDGKNFYMHLDKYYYKLRRKDNTYEVIAPETTEIVYTFTKKAMDAAFEYFFIWKNPYKLLSLGAFIGPTHQSFTTMKRFSLNILDGRLR